MHIDAYPAEAAHTEADPRTFDLAEAIAYLREQREQASAAFNARFGFADRPRNITARRAMYSGDWAGFFGGLST